MTEQEILALLDALADVGCTVEQGFHEEGQLNRLEYDALTAYLANADEWRAGRRAGDADADADADADDDDVDAGEPCGACGAPLDNPADPLRWNATAVCRPCFDAFLHRGAEQFALRNDKPKPAPWKLDAPERQRQRLLLGGLDCLEGQRDLFATDGERAD